MLSRISLPHISKHLHTNLTRVPLEEEYFFKVFLLQVRAGQILIMGQ